MTNYIGVRIQCSCGEFYARLEKMPEFCPRCQAIDFRILSAAQGQTTGPVPFIHEFGADKFTQHRFQYQRREAGRFARSER